MTATAWDAPLWEAVHTATPGRDRLVVALAAARAVCDATGAELVDDPPFTPAHGWLTTEGLLALLEQTWPLPITPLLALAGGLDPLAEAAQVVDQLLRLAADDVLIELDALRQRPDPDRAEALTATMDGLADGYRLTFGRSW